MVLASDEIDCVDQYPIQDNKKNDISDVEAFQQHYRLNVL
jgi:hypothetical protein